MTNYIGSHRKKRPLNYEGRHREPIVEVPKSGLGYAWVGVLAAASWLALAATGKYLPAVSSDEMRASAETTNPVVCHIGEFSEDKQGARYAHTRKIDVRVALSDNSAQQLLRQVNNVQVDASEETPSGQLTRVQTAFPGKAQVPTRHGNPILSLFPKEADATGTKLTFTVTLPGVGNIPCSDQLVLGNDGRWQYGGPIQPDLQLMHADIQDHTK